MKLAILFAIDRVVDKLGLTKKPFYNDEERQIYADL